MRRPCKRSATPLVWAEGRLTEEEQDRLDFDDGLARSVDQRVELGLVPVRIPEFDDVPYRVFDTMDDYRRWLASLPAWLGYGNAQK